MDNSKFICHAVFVMKPRMEEHGCRLKVILQNSLKSTAFLTRELCQSQRGQVPMTQRFDV